MKLLATLFAVCAACSAPAPSRAPERVRLLVDDAEVGFHDPLVLSIDDSNLRYEITLAGRPETEREHPLGIVLVLGELRLVAQSWGQGSFSFQATAAEARAFAEALGTPARAREPWRGELGATLEPAAELVAGAEHLPLRFTLTNRGPVGLWFQDGGRGRNELGRDNRFTLEIEREGERLELRELLDFGGLGLWRKLAPGESRVLELDLAHWCPLARAGEYVLRVTYEAELMPEEFEQAAHLPLGWPAHLRRVRRVGATLVLQVR